jgi:hypothetical protein
MPHQADELGTLRTATVNSTPPVSWPPAMLPA